MKLSRYDRVQAIHRNPVHKEDLKAFRNPTTGAPIFSLKLMKDYALKWGVTEGILINSEIAALPEEEIEKIALFTDEQIVTIIEHEPSRIDDAPCHAEETMARLKEAFPEAEEMIVVGIDKTPHLRDGRFLTIEIDLANDKKDVEAAVLNTISRYWDRPSDKRVRKTELDKWDVYDKYQEGKTFIEIIGGTEDPDGFAVRSRIEQARKRYAQAEEMIAMVTPKRTTILGAL